ncbi:MAG: RimK-like ATPgrasp N-terminal domain-containing protein [Methanoregula sp.]|jgi:hypothetical protein|nr:RimK-like ATPgrasp N-terminal domain-containing protein [Methanoregula sp.]
MDTRETNVSPLQNDPSAVPAVPVPEPAVTEKEPSTPACSQPFGKPVIKSNGKREQGILKDSLFFIRRGDMYHIISENYSYKTETYYSILYHELEGKPVRPSSIAILDAYVVPLCLERAKRGGIPVCDWGISQGYVPLPVILYGLNYFATTSDFFVVDDSAKAKEVIKHITNIGKYPFCYQKLDEGATVHSCIGIFGKTTSPCTRISHLAQKVYELFSIPLVTMVFIKSGEEYRLSSLAPTKYSQLSGEERTLLSAYLTHQEFL